MTESAATMYFRLRLFACFEGIDTERGIVRRANNSLALRRFLRLGLDEDHSTNLRAQEQIGLETHREVSQSVLRGGGGE